MSTNTEKTTATTEADEDITTVIRQQRDHTGAVIPDEIAVIEEETQPPSGATTQEAPPDSCARCGAEFESFVRQRHRDGRLLCRWCIEVLCADCGREGVDVMRRSIPGMSDPVFCTACCATYSGRAWMRPESSSHASTTTIAWSAGDDHLIVEVSWRIAALVLGPDDGTIDRDDIECQIQDVLRRPFGTYCIGDEPKPDVATAAWTIAEILGVKCPDGIGWERLVNELEHPEEPDATETAIEIGKIIEATLAFVPARSGPR
jgi:hypothetical protein